MEITGQYPPAIIISPTNNKRYAVSGDQWVEITPDITHEEVLRSWKPLFHHQENNPNKGQFEIYTVPSSTTQGQNYVVTNKQNQWFCNCIGFNYRGKCSHIDKLKQKI